ncbi:MAG TPA: ribosome biogenesis GTP-binding protein YihA/YsxC [Thermoanaerobaculia bacterium]|nr:ribosome biogenesis GTP-binding protein YihA/YsxC [Thermoanaerobaculia bacterium]
MKIQTAVFVGACGKPEEFFGDGTPEVAFAGRSNVGKSSLLNRLVGSSLARTSSTPGRTQTVNWYRIDGRWWLVDLPGYGYAKASRTAREAWARLIASYFAGASSRRLVVQLVDARVGATPLDIEAGAYFDGLGVARLVVATKVDRLKRSGRARARDGIVRALNLETEAELLDVSATSGEGIRELWKRISDFLAG